MEKKLSRIREMNSCP